MYKLGYNDPELVEGEEMNDLRHLIKYSSKEVKEATNHFSADNLVGCGAFGRVYVDALWWL